MHGQMENAIYGGRVDNTYDMRVLTSYLVQFFNSTVLSGHVSLLPLPWEPNHCECLSVNRKHNNANAEEPNLKLDLSMHSINVYLLTMSAINTKSFPVL